MMKKFNAEQETKNIISFIRNYYQENNLGGAVIGISGGKDSGVVAALFTSALGKENVVGVTLPCHSKEEDKIDAKLISDYYGFDLINFDITKTFDTFKEELKGLGDFNIEETKNSDINLKPRLRMATLYYLAALYSNLKQKTYLVAGTSNKCELYVGYFTKGGDSVHDISVLAYKKPNDGLSNQTDEDKLGVKYSEIADYMEDKNLLDPVTSNKISTLHQSNLHKFTIPTYRRNDAI